LKNFNDAISNRAKIFTAALCAAIIVLSSSTPSDAARHVFLFIGDGMGAAQRNAAELYLAGMRLYTGDESPRDSQLVMNSLTANGEIFTDSQSGVTDSAAAGSALATGRKTTNGTVAMDGAGVEKFDSIAKIARDRGMKVGIVTSAFLEDATPAAFYAHAPKRTLHYAIGSQLPGSGFDFFGGGGFRSPTGSDKKSRSVIDIASSKGYRVVTTREGFESLVPGVPAIAISPGVSSGYMPWAIDAHESISLAEFVRKGIYLLGAGGDAFFMMVEGGKIDLACHANDAASAIHEVIAFDEAIAEALAFLSSHPDDTLIVVTSDHETGGMSLSITPDGGTAFYSAMSRQKGSYAAFERTLSPKSASAIDEYLAKARGFFGEALTATDGVKRAFAMSATPKNDRPVKGAEYKKLYATYDPFTVACVREMNARAGVTWSTFYHTGKPVPVSAVGAGAGAFAGAYENTGIFDRLRNEMSQD
jgi:alkaline phosphatase